LPGGDGYPAATKLSLYVNVEYTFPDRIAPNINCNRKKALRKVGSADRVMTPDSVTNVVILDYSFHVRMMYGLLIIINDNNKLYESSKVTINYMRVFVSFLIFIF